MLFTRQNQVESSHFKVANTFQAIVLGFEWYFNVTQQSVITLPQSTCKQYEDDYTQKSAFYLANQLADKEHARMRES